MRSPLRVAICEMTSSDNLTANEAQLLDLADQAVQERARWLCFPENSLFMKIEPQSSLASFDLSEEIFRKLEKLCRQKQCFIFLGSIPYREMDGRVSNATVLVGPEKTSSVIYRKMHLFDVDVEGTAPVRESDQFVHGPQPEVIECDGWKVGLSICYDLRFAELYTQYARENIDLIMVPSAFLLPTGRAHWEILLRARAIESQAFVVAASQGGEAVGLQGGRRKTYGHSMVVDPWGQILAEVQTEDMDQQSGAPPSARVRVVELDPEQLKKVKKQIPMAQHRRI